MAKRSFLQLAHPLNLKKHSISGAFVSEKLDGIRAMWDGGVSRGLPVEQVPWSNIEKSNAVPLATGLWSRYGKVINAPNWWLDNLPNFPLDGELWTGRGSFQQISSVVRSNVHTKDWSDIKFMVFDSPNPHLIFEPATINETNFKKSWGDEALDFYTGREPLSRSATFPTRYKWLLNNLDRTYNLLLHQHIQLPRSTDKALATLNKITEEVLDQGGEGTMVRLMTDFWLPERCHTLLKYKPFLDAEAKVVGYQWGRETEKGSKLLGLMGSLICEISAGRFKLSGFTDAERRMIWPDGTPANDVGEWHPGEDVQDDIHNPLFPRGTTVTYKYRETTDDGLPKEARYWRKS